MLRERELEQVRTGDLNFGAYAAATAGEWFALACWVHGRWVVPPCAGVEDVMQELLLAAWTAIGQWDSTRGYSLRSYVVWCAISAASHWLHAQRQAKGQKGSSPSRFAIGLDHGPNVAQWEPSDPESQVVAREAFAKAFAGLKDDEREVMTGIAQTGDVSLVAGLLYRDTDFRRRNRLGNEQEARRFARSALRRVVNAV